MRNAPAKTVGYSRKGLVVCADFAKRGVVAPAITYVLLPQTKPDTWLALGGAVLLARLIAPAWAVPFSGISADTRVHARNQKTDEEAVLNWRKLAAAFVHKVAYDA